MTGSASPPNPEPSLQFRLGRLATELQWQGLLRELPVAVYMTDAAGCITFYNEAAAKLWGYRPEIGKARYNGALRLFQADGTPLPHERGPLARSLRKRRPVLGMQTIAQRPDGSRVHFIPYPTPLFNAAGELTGAVNLMIDVTERHEAEQSALRLAAIVESSEDAIWAKDLTGAITNWNGAATRLFGYSTEEMVGRPVTMLIPLERHDEEPEILARIRTGERINQFETVRRRKDGSLLEVSYSVSPLKNSDGRIVGASTIVRDITEQKRARERQALLLQEMSHRVKNLFALSSAIVTLSGRSSSSVDELVRSVQDRLAALARGHELTLADFQQKGVAEPTTLHTLIRTIIAPFEATAGERVLIAGPDVPVAGPAVTGLALVFHELATNAAKYGALSGVNGGVEIVTTVKGAELNLSWMERGGPPVSGAPGSTGFGTWLSEGTVKNHLHGTLSRKWQPDGLVIAMTLPLAQLDGSGPKA
ncbi:PAS domain S-box-containing protein [Inquilinus ginsengisoli]|uniref:PAS domain S-box protein n=1 Tax=Inquilinus ginsengisoli TaxID=363840 RepID=UPI003D223424